MTGELPGQPTQPDVPQESTASSADTTQLSSEMKKFLHGPSPFERTPWQMPGQLDSQPVTEPGFDAWSDTGSADTARGFPSIKAYREKIISRDRGHMPDMHLSFKKLAPTFWDLLQQEQVPTDGQMEEMQRELAEGQEYAAQLAETMANLKQLVDKLNGSDLKTLGTIMKQEPWTKTDNASAYREKTAEQPAPADGTSTTPEPPQPPPTNQ